MPVSIKDNMCIKDFKLHVHPACLRDFVAPYDATVITKLKQADAIFVGKTNMDEFAMGSQQSSAHSVRAKTRGIHSTFQAARREAVRYPYHPLSASHRWVSDTGGFL